MELTTSDERELSRLWAEHGNILRNVAMNLQHEWEMQLSVPDTEFACIRQHISFLMKKGGLNEFLKILSKHYALRA